MLAGLAGWVDAVGLARLGGVFVSFMSGNTTNIGVALARLDGDHAAVAALVVGLFVVGVVVGEFTRPVGGKHGRGLVLLLVAILLGIATAAARGRIGPMTVAGPMVLAMGAQNAASRRIGSADFGTTYVTGTLVHLGAALAAGLRGQSFGNSGALLMMWIGLVTGALLGTVALRYGPDAALAIPAAGALLLSVWALFRRE